VNFIVEPATRIVASIQREPRLQAGFARMRSGTKTDLRVYTESSSDTTWVTIEDKRLEVFEEHRDELLSISTKSFPWPTSATPPPGSAARIWIQVLALLQRVLFFFSDAHSRFGVSWKNIKSIMPRFSQPPAFYTCGGIPGRTNCFFPKYMILLTEKWNAPPA
jgi:hypothetical protein